ncbi:putative serine/threonine-protein kinase [Hordeum vulgare]|nr:putative serine/threonine-protein kinase [Hordeum vulgare]
MDGDLDLDAATGLASLASGKGKPRASRKTAAPKPKKVLTANQRAKESAKRKDRRHAASARDEAIAAAAAISSQHGLINTVVAAAVSTGSSAFPHALLPDWPRASSCNPVPGFHVYLQAFGLLGEWSPEVNVVAPSTPAPTTIDLNATPVAGGSSSGGARKRVRQTPANQLRGACNLFDGMPAVGNDD